MKISLIIPTRNAEKYMDKLLNKLISQTVNIHEIIVIDTESKDKTIEICSRFEKVKLIQIKQSEFDHGSTRNRAAKESTGDFIVFLTQDAIPENEYFIENILKPFDDPQVGGVYGRQIARPDATPLERFAREFNYPDYDIVKSKKDIERLGIKAFFFTDVCSAFRRSDFDSVGGFPENVILSEDMIIASKLLLNDKLIVYASGASVIHSHNYTLIQQFNRNFDIGACLKMNKYILKYARTEAEGKKFVKNAVKHLASKKKYFCILKLFMESAFKFAGYRFGLIYNLLPFSIVRRFSMHKFYWDRNRISNSIE